MTAKRTNPPYAHRFLMAGLTPKRTFLSSFTSSEMRTKRALLKATNAQYLPSVACDCLTVLPEINSQLSDSLWPKHKGLDTRAEAWLDCLEIV